jgi:hypothetical protein
MDTRLVSRDMCEAGDSAGVVLTLPVYTFASVPCALDPSVPRELGVPGVLGVCP